MNQLHQLFNEFIADKHTPNTRISAGFKAFLKHKGVEYNDEAKALVQAFNANIEPPTTETMPTNTSETVINTEHDIKSEAEQLTALLDEANQRLEATNKKLEAFEELESENTILKNQNQQRKDDAAKGGWIAAECISSPFFKVFVLPANQSNTQGIVCIVDKEERVSFSDMEALNLFFDTNNNTIIRNT